MDDEKINGENIVIQRYKKSGVLFHSNLNGRYRSYDTTKQGAEKAQDFRQSVDDLRRDGRCYPRYSRTTQNDSRVNLMARMVYAKQNDTLDSIVYRYFGKTLGLVEHVLG